MLAAVDSSLLLLSAGREIVLDQFALTMLNLAIVILARRGRQGRIISDMRSLPALAAAGTIVIKVTGSRIKLIELLSTSKVSGMEPAFGRALHSCYRGTPVEKALADASASLPFRGLKRGLIKLDQLQGLETIEGQASKSGVDLSEYYLQALGRMETRVSLVQGLSFFLPLIALIAFPRFFNGWFDAAAVAVFSFSVLDSMSPREGR